MTREEAKHLSDVLKAYSEGKEIEVMYENGKWIPLCKDPYFTGDPMSYRIKPEPKLRPYANAEEFLNAQKEHGPYITQNNINYYCYQRITNDYVQFAQGTSDPLTFEDMLKCNYKWQDGTPCGVVE